MSISRPRHFNEIKSEGGGGITPAQQEAIEDNTAKITSNWTLNGDDIYSSNSGNVGIGTSSPGYPLDIQQVNYKGIRVVCGNINTEILRFSQNTGSPPANGGSLRYIGSGNDIHNAFRITMDNQTGTDIDALSILQNGKVGIGTTSPACPLHVKGQSGSVSAGSEVSYFWANYVHGQGIYHVSRSFVPTIYGEHNIVAGSYIVASNGNLTSSDSRIKNNIQDINDSTALNILRQLKPKTYGYNDVVARGSDEVVGFIAQEVKELIPSAVSITTQFLPNIYCVSTLGAEGVVEFDTNKMITGDNVTGRISLRDKNNGEQILEVGDYTSISTGIQVSKDISEYVGDNNEIFIYGQEVNDFHLLKKESIFTVATAALQEVDRQLQAEKVKTATLETTVADLVARIAALENA